MKPGTIVQLPDGRVGTVVYHGLDGDGIAWGRIHLDPDFLSQASEAWATQQFGRDFDSNKYPAVPVAVAMLRETKNAYLWPKMEVVGEDYEILETPR